MKNWDVSQLGEDPAVWKNRGRHTRFAAGAARQAVQSSGVLDSAGLDPERFGVYLGSGEGSQDFFSFADMMAAALAAGPFDLERFIKRGLELLNPAVELEQEPNMPAGHVAAMFDARGPNFNCLTACAASSQAVGEATEMIRRGDADVMLSGGTHSMIHPLGVTGFSLLTALSRRNDEPTRASRPFDRLRDGFVIGEGAAMVVLEDLERAKRRGAPIYGEIVGYGATADAYRITDIHPQGRGAIACMRMALKDAGTRARRCPLRQCAWDQHGRERSRRNGGLQRSLRRPGLSGPYLEHQEHDGTLDCGGRRDGADRLHDGHARSGPAAHHQLRKSRSRLRSGLRTQRSARGKVRRGAEQQLRLRWPEHHAHCAPLRGVDRRRAAIAATRSSGRCPPRTRPADQLRTPPVGSP